MRTLSLPCLTVLPLLTHARPSDPFPAVSGTTDSPNPLLPHVRVLNERLRQIIDRATAASPTLQRLMALLEESDVVVYIQCDMRLPSRVAGRLSFVSAAAGVRYVLIRVAYVGAVSPQAALIGHELRHAVEVAERPAIVDDTSFDREYARIGFVTTSGSAYGVNRTKPKTRGPPASRYCVSCERGRIDPEPAANPHAGGEGRPRRFHRTGSVCRCCSLGERHMGGEGGEPPEELAGQSGGGRWGSVERDHPVIARRQSADAELTVLSCFGRTHVRERSYQSSGSVRRP